MPVVIRGREKPMGAGHRPPADRETSGLVVIAKTPAAFDHLRRQFRERKVEKLYRALVWGESAEGVIDFPFAHDPRDKKRMCAVPSTAGEKGSKIWQATTRYRRLARRTACLCWKSKWRPESRIRFESISPPSVIRSSPIALRRSAGGYFRAPTALFACLEIALRPSLAGSEDELK